MSWAAGEFATRVIGWQQRHGRRDLPWGGTRDPYRVWLSEIMLQQTQVATVLAYYPRFLARFADVRALAAAPLEDVLALWSGLGYYSRARHLHRCARQVVAEGDGQFPASAAQLERLPGIGRSTAAAIAAFCHGERSAILDGNVKRVLARVFGIADDLGRAPALRDLWQRAQDLLPTEQLKRRMPAYTQGLMDLGATVCLPRRPRCAECPLADRCVARAAGDPERYPLKSRSLQRREMTLWLLHAVDSAGRTWLVQRPERGIWARLHCLPAFESRAALLQALPAAARPQMVEHPVFTHVLTHRDLRIHVLTAATDAQPGEAQGGWFGTAEWPAVGLPAPVRAFLQGWGEENEPLRPRPARGGAAASPTGR